MQSLFYKPHRVLARIGATSSSCENNQQFDLILVTDDLGGDFDIFVPACGSNDQRQSLQLCTVRSCTAIGLVVWTTFESTIS